MSSDATTTVADYLLTRLEQVGVTKVMGTPGDFTLTLLDAFEGRKVEYVNAVNELNGAYAADGYARVTGGLGALCTTFGVGELSAVNGIAGAYAERVPVLHIVGCPTTKLQAKHRVLHHTLGDGRFDVFASLQSNITADQAIIHSVEGSGPFGASAGEQIDRVIKSAIIQCRPTYLLLPTDLFYAKLPRKPLDTPLTYQSIVKNAPQPEVDDGLVNHVIETIVKMYEASQQGVVIVDACAVRYHVLDEVDELLKQTGMTYYTSPMGKAAFDETNPSFGGIYVGAITEPAVKEKVESADFTLNIGLLNSDFNTGSFSYQIPAKNMVELHSDHTVVQYAHYPGLGFRYLLPRLTAALAKTKSASKVEKAANAGMVETASHATAHADEKLTQETFWPLCGRHLKENDVVIAETGTSLFGILDVKMPKGVTFLGQVLWGSIGWAGGAVMGAALAAREQNRRTVLFTGEGSWMLSIQEVSTLIRQGVKPICIVINNKGYAIERRIHGKDAKYNDVGDWQWQQTFAYFGAKKDETASYRVETNAELEKVLALPSVVNAEKLTLIEVIMDYFDAPRGLIQQAEMTEKANAE